MTDSASPAAVPVSGTVEVPAVAASCFPDEPCDPPVVAGQLVLSHDGDVVARVPLGARGAFTTRLPPGTYAVSVTPGGPGMRLRPGAVTVPPEGLTDVRLRLVGATS